MALDRATRSTLRNTVTRCRGLLEEAVGDVLEGRLGIRRSGEVEDAARMTHLSEEEQQHREQVISHLRHIEAGSLKSNDAVARLIREVSYTHLNRLCAFKMLERRGLRREAVGRGINSQGFMFYLADHREDGRLYDTGRQDEAYRNFLRWLGGTLSEEIGILFSPTDPAHHLFPPQRVLNAVLDLINAEELHRVWDEEETIGWVYQFYTPKELRDKARKESRAPRGSYELAFRNQFYTPDYVVRFLTDNTLGRTWYEMRQGNTRLAGQCEYLVRRPDEVFFAQDSFPEIAKAQRWLQGEAVPEPDVVHLGHAVNGYSRAPAFGEGGNRWVEDRLPRLTGEKADEFKTQDLLDLLFLFCRKDRFAEGTLDDLADEIEAIMGILRERVDLGRRDNLPQEERLYAPVYIPYRELKEPRQLRILDPACGSGHFLLYCFDLLQTIYEEAYDDENLGEALRKEYPDRNSFRCAVPALILRHNLHGIDIDVRATQIAALALWLRAQRAYGELGLKDGERPRITRSNIVCAEPMPGEHEMLEEFTQSLEPTVLRQLVEVVFDKMKLADEAGSLLKIEEEIEDAIARARVQWQRESERATDRGGNELLLTHSEMDRLSSRANTQMDLFDVSQVTDEEFWAQAEGRVSEALGSYSTSATDGESYQRKLFADDSTRGFAYVDICRKRFDVVLMNPPFGEASKPSKAYIDGTYPRTKGDLLANFIERALSWCSAGGVVGAISSRTCFFLGSFSSLREEVLREDGHLSCMADLGDGVLEAMVETSAYVLARQTKAQLDSVFFRMLLQADKASSLHRSVKAVGDAVHDENRFLINTAKFSQLPGSPYAYWVESEAIRTLTKERQLEGNFGRVRVGLQTSNDNRFLRLIWEVSPANIGVASNFSDPNTSSYVNEIRSSFRNGRRWAFYSKTDTASPWISPLTLVVDWSGDGDTIKEYVRAQGDSPSRSVRSESSYFKPGFGYMLRSARLVPYIVPAGVIPTAGRAQVQPFGGYEHALLGFCASNVASAVARFSGEKFAYPKFQASMVQNLPTPNMSDELRNGLADRIEVEVNARRAVVQGYEPYQEFVRPAWFTRSQESSTGWSLMSLLGDKLEKDVAAAFGLSESQLQELERDIREAVSKADHSTTADDAEHAAELVDSNATSELVDESLASKSEGLISYCLGCVFGRWDIRLAKDESLAPASQDPFDPLPACPPGMLVGPDGLPASRDGIVSEEWMRARPNAITLPPEDSVQNPTIYDSEYLINVDWDGILVDDSDHPDDIVRRVREVLELLWAERADEIEGEACELLGVKDLRTYLRNPRQFFEHHIKRYSKSRRKAPIYWLLQSHKRNYGLWLYTTTASTQTSSSRRSRTMSSRRFGWRRAVWRSTSRVGRAPAAEVARPSRRRRRSRSRKCYSTTCASSATAWSVPRSCTCAPT
jgi:hypothetical protein